MTPRNFVSVAGYIILIAGIYCPLISPLGMVSWSLSDLNKTFAFILQAVAFAGIIVNLKKQSGFGKKLYTLNAWLALGMVILLFVAVKMKVNTTFSFIPLPKLAQTMSGFIYYKWGWFLLFTGPVLALLGSRKTKNIHPAGK